MIVVLLWLLALVLIVVCLLVYYFVFVAWATMAKKTQKKTKPLVL